MDEESTRRSKRSGVVIEVLAVSWYRVTTKSKERREWRGEGRHKCYTGEQVAFRLAWRQPQGQYSHQYTDRQTFYGYAGHAVSNYWIRIRNGLDYGKLGPHFRVLTYSLSVMGSVLTISMFFLKI